MMDIIAKCMRSSDLSGLHALQSMWDNSDPLRFSSDIIVKSKKTLLMIASRKGLLESCKFLLSIHSPNINTRNIDGFTALHYAAYHGHDDVVFLLLEAGADPKLVNNLNESALDAARAGSHTNLVNRLKSSRFLKEEIIFPGLFDFSGAFLSDLKEKLLKLPSAETAIPLIEVGSSNADVKAAPCTKSTGNDSSSNNKDVKTIDINTCKSSSSNNSHRNISSSSKSSNFHRSLTDGDVITGCTAPGDDCALSDGEIVEYKTVTHRKSEDKIESRNAISSSSDGRLQKRRKTAGNVDGMSSDEEHRDVAKTSGLSRYEALKYFIEVISVVDGGEESLVGLKYNLLGSSVSNGSGVDAKEAWTGTRDVSGSLQVRVKDDLTIGRSRTSDFSLDDLSISKKHAVISYFETVGFILRDLGSKHGTFSDGLQIGIAGSGSTKSEQKSVSEHTSVSIAKNCDRTRGSTDNVTYSSSTTVLKNTDLENTEFRRNNNGLLLCEGMTLQFGRVVCRLFKKRQSAVISGSFQPSTGRSLQQDDSVCGQKRTALMALYGHYQKTEKPSEERGKKSEGNGSYKKSSSTVFESDVSQKIKQHQQLQLRQQQQQQLDLQQDEKKQIVTDVGASLLRKMGWEGAAIGRSGAPAAKPLTAVMRIDREGLGCEGSKLRPPDISIYGGTYDTNTYDKKAVMRNKMIARFQNAP